tara:strand:+ start:557 stop:835 length:279 start_codon:yes stop_codon:yes gene_type:complete
LNESLGETMNSQEDLVSEYNASVEVDLNKRKRSIEEGEALDKEINRRLDAEEIGVTLGTDHHVGVLMLGLATIFTLIALYLIFGVSPDRINS